MTKEEYEKERKALFDEYAKDSIAIIDKYPMDKSVRQLDGAPYNRELKAETKKFQQKLDALLAGYTAAAEK
jgi:hypothetical protein